VKLVDADAVQGIDKALKTITRHQFGEHFSPTALDKQMLEPQIWNDGDSVLDEVLWPAFDRLRSLFGRAAAAKQNVVVDYT
jgi:hypothetical protein